MSKFLHVLAPFIVVAGACTTTPPLSNEDGARMLITGTTTYRERMQAPKGSMVLVTLQDISRADAPAGYYYEQRIDLDGVSIPVAYRLQPRASDLKPGMRYTVRSEIRSANGDLLWTSDTVHPVDPAAMRQKLPTIVMVRVNR